MRSLSTILFALLIALAEIAMSQSHVAISYFDLGELRDTIKSPFYFDEAYTPNGRKRWTTHRYEEEVNRVAAVIDSMAFPIVALYGVETEAVVRDIVMASSEDYCYIYRELDYYDGLDFALLYYGDQLFVERVVSGNTWLSVSGEIFERSIDINLLRLASRVRSVKPLAGQDVADITVVMGRLRRRDLARFGAVDVLATQESSGGGDTLGERGWFFNSRVGLLTDQEIVRAGCYITDWLMRPEPYEPHLPLYVVVSVE